MYSFTVDGQHLAKYQVGYRTVDGWGCYGYSRKADAHACAKMAAKTFGHAELIIRKDGREYDVYYDLQDDGTVKAVEM